MCEALAEAIELACLKVACHAARRLSADSDATVSAADTSKRLLKRYMHSLDKRLSGITRCTEKGVRVEKPQAE